MSECTTRKTEWGYEEFVVPVRQTGCNRVVFVRYADGDVGVLVADKAGKAGMSTLIKSRHVLPFAEWLHGMRDKQSDHVRYETDIDGMSVNATLSVRIDRKDFERIVGEPLDEDEFKDIVTAISRRMLTASVGRESQAAVMRGLGFIE